MAVVEQEVVGQKREVDCEIFKSTRPRVALYVRCSIACGIVQPIIVLFGLYLIRQHSIAFGGNLVHSFESPGYG